MSRAKTSWTILLACVALLVVDLGTMRAQRGGRGARMSARTSVNRSANFNRNVDVNRNFNRNVDVNRNFNRNIDFDRDVNIDVDRNFGGWGGCCYHPVARATAATAAAVTTAAVVGSVVGSLPTSCQAVSVNGYTYQQCGSTWYMPQFSGSSVTYVVINPPR